MTYTFMFPGQGSQKVGMAADACETFPSVRKRFEEADSLLGYSLSSIVFNGPEEKLKSTEHTQPALFTVSASLCDVLSENRIVPGIVLGHSLGEFSALYAAGIFSFSEGLRLVAQRGRLMAEAGKESAGAMAAVIGLPREVIEKTIADISDKTVVCANENSPTQTVISGDTTAIDRACDALKKAGAKRAIKLPVGGAFHSPLMTPAAEQFKSLVTSVSFATPHCPVICNASAQAETDPLVIRERVIEQLTSPVKWVDSLRTLLTHNTGPCLEIGPGNVLRGLARQNSDKLQVLPCGTVEDVYLVTSSAT